jgi:hypothetical protein
MGGGIEPSLFKMAIAPLAPALRGNTFFWLAMKRVIAKWIRKPLARSSKLSNVETTGFDLGRVKLLTFKKLLIVKNGAKNFAPFCKRNFCEHKKFYSSGNRTCRSNFDLPDRTGGFLIHFAMETTFFALQVKRTIAHSEVGKKFDQKSIF